MDNIFRFSGFWRLLTFVFQDIIVFVFLYIASELARTSAKTVTFITTPDTEPSTPTRTGRSEFSTFALFFWCLLYIQLSPSFRSVSLRPDQRGESRTPQRVSLGNLFLPFFYKLWWSGFAAVSEMLSPQCNLCFLYDRRRRFSLSPQHPTGSGREWQVSLTCYSESRVSYTYSNKCI